MSDDALDPASQQGGSQASDNSTADDAMDTTTAFDQPGAFKWTQPMSPGLVSGPTQNPTPAAGPATANAANHISGKAMFFGSLLKTLTMGMKAGAAQGNPRNAFDRGVSAGIQAPRAQVQQLNDDQMTTAKIALAQAQAQHAIEMAHQFPTERVYELQTLGYKAGLEADKGGAEDVIQATTLPEAQAYALQQNGKKDGYTYNVYPANLNTDDPSKTTYVVKKASVKGMLHDVDVPMVTTNEDTGEQEVKWTHVDTISQADFQAMTSKTMLGNAQNTMKGQVQSVVRTADTILSDPSKVDSVDKAQSYLSNLQSTDQKYLQAHPAIQDKVARAQQILQSIIQQGHQRDLEKARAGAAIKVDEHNQEKQADRADDQVYAMKDGQKVLMTYGDAKEQGLQIASPKLSEANLNEDRSYQRRVNDVTEKLERYKSSFQTLGDTNSSDRDKIATILNNQEATLGSKVLGLETNVGGWGDILARDKSFRELQQMNPKAAAALQDYLSAKSMVLELQKMESNSSRLSAEGLKIDSAQLPRPGVGWTAAQRSFKNLDDQMDNWAEGSPHFADIRSREQVIQKQRDQDKQERQAADALSKEMGAKSSDDLLKIARDQNISREKRAAAYAEYNKRGGVPSLF